MSTIGDSDVRWYTAMEAESQARASSEQAARTARERVNTMLLAARSFLATVLDSEAHRVPRILAHAMNGMVPSVMERASDRERIHALRSLVTFMRQRSDLSFDASALTALAQAVDAAEAALVQAIQRRGEWHARVTTKRAETLAFDEGYAAFVGCLRSSGGPELLRELLPSFARRRRSPVEEQDLPPGGGEDELELQGADDAGTLGPASAEAAG